MSGDSTPTIVIAGHYGFGNLGDELILHSLVDGIRDLRPDADIRAISGDPSQTRTEHGVEAVAWTSIEGIVEAVRKSHLLILGGGGVLHDYWEFDPTSVLTKNHSGLAFFCGLPLLGAALGKPVCICGIGVGPLTTEIGRSFTRLACQSAHLVTVRDDYSKRVLHSIGVRGKKIRVTADPAFAYATSSVTRNISRAKLALHVGTRRPLIAVTLRTWDIGVESERWEGEVAKALDSFLRRSDGEALFVPCQTTAGGSQNDFDIAVRVRERMLRQAQTSIAREGLNPGETAQLVQSSDVLLGMRLHSIILATSAGVPTVALAYDPKVASLMQRIGSGAYSLSLQSLAADRLAERLGHAYSSRHRRVNGLKSAAAELASLARENSQLAVSTLEKTGENGHVPHEPGLQTLSRIIVGHASELAGREKDLELLREERLALQDAVQRLRAENDEKESEAAQLRQSLEDEIAEGRRAAKAMERVRVESDQLRDELAKSTRQVARYEGSLQAIHLSRYWRVMSRYWRARGILSALFARSRSAIRRVVPYRLRSSLVLAARRTGLHRASRAQPRSMTPERPEGVAPSFRRPKYAVICFPIIDWEFRFQRPQQLVSQFAAAGHRCYYLATTFHGHEAAIERWAVAENVETVRLPARASLNPYRGVLTSEARDDMLAALAVLRDDVTIEDAVCIVQLPFWAPLAMAARERWGWKVVYDCMDEHSGFSTNGREMLQAEESLLRAADLVVTTSRALHDKASARASNLLYLPNGADYSHFVVSAEEGHLRSDAGAIVGYYGAISDWFDTELIGDVARSRPGWQFHLIGDTAGADLRPLRGLPNVHLMGEKPYSELPAYLHQFDVACIPFKDSALTRATNPVKFYEYLSAGKPVVSSPLPELESLSQYFYAATDGQEFVRQVERAIEEDTPERAMLRQEFAKANTWTGRYRVLDDSICRLFGRAVIIVVCRDNLEYTRLCLDSIWARTSYPRFRVVVVDNGSRPEVISALREMADAEPRMMLVEAGQNLGFAKANNLGIAAAGECEYVILLNNDTVVSHGWLTRLIRHLQEPGTALVGPVTNRIGNEAQIPVNYNKIDDMEQFAEEYTRARQGDAFEIAVLAMFCVAMRRSLLTEIGMLDERFGVGLFEDDDFSLRARRAGGRLLCAEDVFVHHWGQATFASMPPADYDRLFVANRRKFEEKWGKAWQPHRHRVRASGKALPNPSQGHADDRRALFSSYYASGFWPGPGSTVEYTENIRKEIPRLLRRRGIRTILDAPCGDYGWFRLIERDLGAAYIGGDIVGELVASHQKEFGSPRTRFEVIDIMSDMLPKVDLWLCRDCLFHFSNADIFSTLNNFLRSDIPLLLTTTHPKCKENTDITTGSFRLLNLEIPPFSLPEPIDRMDDWIDGHPVRQLALWERASIARALGFGEDGSDPQG